MSPETPQQPIPQGDCGCIDRIRKELTERYGEKSNVWLGLAPTIDVATGETGSDLPPLYYSREQGKRRRRRGHVRFNFCPFCGKPKQ